MAYMECLGMICMAYIVSICVDRLLFGVASGVNVDMPRYMESHIPPKTFQNYLLGTTSTQVVQCSKTGSNWLPFRTAGYSKSSLIACFLVREPSHTLSDADASGERRSSLSSPTGTNTRPRPGPVK